MGFTWLGDKETNKTYGKSMERNGDSKNSN